MSTTVDGKTTTKIVTTEESASLADEFSERLTFPEMSSRAALNFDEGRPGQSQRVMRPAGGGASAGTSAAKPISVGEFEKQCLEAHNRYRAKHGVPAVKLSKQLCSYAGQWANKLAAEDKFQHRSEHKYGENIYCKWSSDPNVQVTGAEAVDSWYSEIKDHSFGVEPRSLKSGHFTQVIWKDCKEIGAAFAKSKGGKVLVVANYDPPGNMMGKFASNVPPPK